MKSTTATSTVLALGLATTSALAQTPPGFKPSTNTILPLTFGNATVTRGGTSVPLSQTGLSPAVDLTFSAPSSSPANYILMMLDLDAPGGAADDSYSPLLHWMLPIASTSDFLSSSSSEGSNTTTTTLSIPANTTSAPANAAAYVGPAPGAGTGPHRYTLLLVADPAGDEYGWSSSSSGDGEFVLPPSFAGLDFNDPTSIEARLVFDVERFVAEGGFAPAVAGTWVSVANETAADATTTTTTTTSSPTTVPTGGAANTNTKKCGGAGLAAAAVAATLAMV